ncbi:hypothetical protein [Pseudomonas tohonis]|uniref:hypothetical protein n=1 Tax=Pseudomonas tohonis TaxID=2725477 RepID=UPI00255B891B|nr:hypothetical protein [Pseudomonas tohonis]
MRHHTPAPLVRFHIHIRRDHIHRLTELGNSLARRKGRDVRLGEALELALTAGHAWTDSDLLDLAPDDKDAPHWLQLGPLDRFGGKALLPSNLRDEQ